MELCTRCTLNNHSLKLKPPVVAGCENSCRSVPCRVRERSNTGPTESKLFDINGAPYMFPGGLEQEVDKIRQMLIATSDQKDPMESLVFVDTIQQVGVHHHFLEEIQKIVNTHFETTTYGKISRARSLHDVSLSFRLLRQHGHDMSMSPDVLKIYEVKNGMFRGDRKEVISGLMELYEAAQLGFEGEDELHEAGNISSQILSEHFADVEYNLSKVSFRLLYPCHKSISGLTNKRFIQNSVYVNGWDKALGELAAIDIRERQPVYQQECHQISRWWNELGFAKEVQLARNQPLKWYTWSMAILIDDFSLSKQRVQLTKCIAFIYLIDDIFDLYGTPEDLTIFTEAVNKWDYAAMETLPDYMKMSYKALLDTTNEIALNIYENHGYNPIDSLKTTWASLCNAFLREAKWFASGEKLTSEEYLENGIVSSGVHVVLVHLFFLLGLGGTKNGPAELKGLVRSVATILRVWDDLGSAKDEHQDGKDGSYIEYFMQEHPSITIGQARDHAMELIASAWRRLNQECSALNSASTLPFKNGCLNLARMVPLMYKYDENQKLPVLKEKSAVLEVALGVVKTLVTTSWPTLLHYLRKI